MKLTLVDDIYYNLAFVNGIFWIFFSSKDRNEAILIVQKDIKNQAMMKESKDHVCKYSMSYVYSLRMSCTD